MSNQLNPYNVICVCKHKGKEVGRIAAAAQNASEYINGLASYYKEITVDYVEDKTAAMISQLFSQRR